MCIAILNTKQAGTLSNTTIYNSWENNDMGAGLLWNKKGKLHEFKTYDYDEFLDKYIKIRKDKAVENIVLHFRIATSGVEGKHNLHPFMTNNDLGFVHNGVISGLGNKEFSDTFEFNEMLKKFNHDFVNCDMTKKFIEEYISYSKLIFLDSDGVFNIFNEHLGSWAEGNWYSNDSYKAVYSYSYAGNVKVSKASKSERYDYYPSGSYIMESFNSADLVGIELEMYLEICAEYGFEPYGLDADDQVEWAMDVNNCSDVTSLYNKLYYDVSYKTQVEDAWDF